MDNLRSLEEHFEGNVAHNLHLMETEMMELLEGESWGGNAGFVERHGKRYPCCAANGIMDPQTGRIRTFSNHDFADIGEVDFWIRFSMLPEERVRDWKVPRQASDIAVRTLEESIKRWCALEDKKELDQAKNDIRQKVEGYIPDPE